MQSCGVLRVVYKSRVLMLKNMVFHARVAGPNSKSRRPYVNETLGIDLFYKAAERARVFVFQLQEEQTWPILGEAKPEEIDLPFPVCSFEGATQVLSWRLKDSIALVKCLVVEELSPRNYRFYAWLHFDDDTENICIIDEQEKAYGMVCLHMKTLLTSLYDGSTATEKVRERIKIGAGKEKRTITIKNIVHISPSKEKTIKPYLGGSIDYSHRFEVMGHWRKLGDEYHGVRVGKDRGGDYCVRGWTWVVPHEKGPENSPLIKKTRVIVNETAENNNLRNGKAVR